MNTIDLAFLALTTLSAVVGLWRGLVKETIALLTWILSIFLALEWQDEMIEWLPDLGSKSLESVIAFVIIFMVVFSLGLIIRFLIRWLIVGSALGPVDRILGGLFGALRGILIAAVIITVGELTPYSKDWDWEMATVTNKLSPLTHWMQTYFHVDEPLTVSLSGIFK